MSIRPLVLTDSTRGAVMRDRSLGHWRELRCPQGPSQCIAQPPPKEQVPQSEYANQPYAHACCCVNKGLHQKKLSGDWNSWSSVHFSCPHYTLHATQARYHPWSLQQQNRKHDPPRPARAPSPSVFPSRLEAAWPSGDKHRHFCRSYLL